MQSRVDVRAVLAVLVPLLTGTLASAAPAAPQERSTTPAVRRVAIETPGARAPSERAILDPTGRVRGFRRAAGGARVTIRTNDGVELEAPAYQHWLASADGRSLVGIGDPRAPEHPFEAAVAVFRDGVPVGRPLAELDPECAVSVAGDGHVAVVGHRAGERGRAFASVLDPVGEPLFQHELGSVIARDPVLLGTGSSTGVMVRVHAEIREGDPAILGHRGGAILFVDAGGVAWRLDVEGALELVGFGRAADGALVRTARELLWISAASRSVVWRTAHALRPASPHAWARWSPSGAPPVVAVLAGDVRRRGAARPPVVLKLFELASGVFAGELEVAPRGPLGSARLFAEERGLVLARSGEQEVFQWNR